MIPIRKYPYTDFHDLNLDWLLRQMNDVLADLEELKRRVKALEDWKVDVDIDITQLKSDMLDVRSRLTTAEGKITALGDNAISYFYDMGNTPSPVFRSGTYDGEIVTDYQKLINDLRIGQTSFGNKTCNLYVYDPQGSGEKIYQCNYESRIGIAPGINITYATVDSLNNVTIKNHFISFSPDLSTITNQQHHTGEGVLMQKATYTISAADCIPTTDPNLSADYPYQFTAGGFDLFQGSFVEMFFNSSDDFVNYSNKVSEYIYIDAGGNVTVYLKEPLDLVTKILYAACY